MTASVSETRASLWSYMPPELPKYAWLTASTSVLAMIGQIASLICNVATFHAQRASLHVATKVQRGTDCVTHRVVVDVVRERERR